MWSRWHTSSSCDRPTALEMNRTCLANFLWWEHSASAGAAPHTHGSGSGHHLVILLLRLPRGVLIAKTCIAGYRANLELGLVEFVARAAGCDPQPTTLPPSPNLYATTSSRTVLLLRVDVPTKLSHIIWWSCKIPSASRGASKLPTSCPAPTATMGGSSRPHAYQAQWRSGSRIVHGNGHGSREATSALGKKHNRPIK